MRVLHVRHDHECVRAAAERQEAGAQRDHREDGRQLLPMRRASADRRGDRGGVEMNALDRREFCKLLGGGIVVLISTPPAELFAQQQPRPYPEDPNAYLRIDENGRITLYSGKVEMGQGINTSLSQMAAEELGVSLDAIDIVMGDTDLVPFDQGTWGSRTTRFFGPAVRAASAEARTVLIRLAAEKLGVPREQLGVAGGVVSGGGKSITYGELAKGKTIARLVGEKAVLRAVKDFKVIGKP